MNVQEKLAEAQEKQVAMAPKPLSFNLQDVFKLASDMRNYNKSVLTIIAHSRVKRFNACQ